MLLIKRRLCKSTAGFVLRRVDAVQWDGRGRGGAGRGRLGIRSRGVEEGTRMRVCKSFYLN